MQLTGEGSADHGRPLVGVGRLLHRGNRHDHVSALRLSEVSSHLSYLVKRRLAERDDGSKPARFRKIEPSRQFQV
jgi:hypothetical protein